jgi:hypothetical protein
VSDIMIATVSVKLSVPMEDEHPSFIGAIAG